MRERICIAVMILLALPASAKPKPKPQEPPSQQFTVTYASVANAGCFMFLTSDNIRYTVSDTRSYCHVYPLGTVITAKIVSMSGGLAWVETVNDKKGRPQPWVWSLDEQTYLPH